MTELFDEEEKTTVVLDDEAINLEGEDPWDDANGSDARRRLEDLLAEKRLKEELDDYFELEHLD